MSKKKKHKIETKSYKKPIIWFALFLCVFALGSVLMLKDTSQNKIGLPTQGNTEVIQEEAEVKKVKKLGYVEITGSCGPYFDVDPCVNIRSGAGTSHGVVKKLRNGVVLRVSGSVEAEGRTWYKIIFDEWVRYPERVESDWYVAADFVRYFEDQGLVESTLDVSDTNEKKIIVDLSEQTLYAYEGKKLFMQELVSTGLELSKTPRGYFHIFRKTPSRYMQGPLPGISDQYYDLPGVPWNLYFTEQGGAIHGTYWHDNFGEEWSHGCVNLPPEKAKELYYWADPGISVRVQD